MVVSREAMLKEIRSFLDKNGDTAQGEIIKQKMAMIDQDDIIAVYRVYESLIGENYNPNKEERHGGK